MRELHEDTADKSTKDKVEQMLEIEFSEEEFIKFTKYWGRFIEAPILYSNMHVFIKAWCESKNLGKRKE